MARSEGITPVDLRLLEHVLVEQKRRREQREFDRLMLLEKTEKQPLNPLPPPAPTSCLPSTNEGLPVKELEELVDGD